MVNGENLLNHFHTLHEIEFRTLGLPLLPLLFS
jgi:hypothetical protein